MRNPIVDLRTYLKHTWVLLRTNWKIGLVVVGLLSAILSWYTDHVEPGNWVANILAPEYTPTLSAYKQMLDSGAELRATDIGFSEIIAVLSETLTGPVTSTVSIKAHRDTLFAVFPDATSGPTIALELTLNDGSSGTVKFVKDLEPAIQKRFLETALVQTGKVSMLAGIIITLIIALVDYLRDARPTVVQVHKTG